MNLAENMLSVHLHSLKPMRLVASRYNLSLSQLICLCVLPVSGIKQTDLAIRLSVDISTLSRNLENLINKKLVKKLTSRLDKRSFVVSLSPLGERVCSDIINSLENYFTDLEGGMSLDDRQRFVDLLSELGWLLEKFHSSYE